ncbi:MAG TPA: ATP-dependent helicase/nuclease subunit A [Ruminiclostridium sp.]|nr:ATP-dependent helicase/nuclease subunit A [Ruminiclostridium sp.]
MNSNAIPDINVRDEIKNNLDVNILVEAGAGSGKTTSIVSRMVSLIISGKCNVENIAAITFTRKAAQELKERFQNSLEQCFYGQQNPDKKEILKEALKNIERCFIGTIHSFCASLLRERPVEASVDPDFVELDDLTDRILHKQAWQQYLLDARLNFPEKLARLNDCGLKPSDLEDIYTRITQYPDVEIVYNEIQKPDIAPAYEKLKMFLKKVKRYIPKTEPEKGYDSLQNKIMTGLRMLRYYDMDNEINRLNLLEMFENDQRVILNRWLCDKEITKDINEEINYLSQTEVRPVLKQWKEYCHYIAVNFLKPAADYYENIKVRQSGLNFQDLLLKAVRMLKNYPEVRSYFKNKYHCLLVDEFQDTDPIQAELMFLLTGQDINEKHWHRLVPSPGSLFVVGDPKQSIYRFRRADIDIYNRVKRLFLETGGKVLELTANFRSMNSLGKWYNRAFSGLLPHEADSYQAAFSPVNTIKDDTEGTDSGVKVLNIPSDFAKKQEIVEQDAENIAKVIRNAVDGNGIKLARTPEEKEEGLSETPGYRDFLILLRYKDSIEVYAKTFKKYGIPVKMSGGSYLSDIEELKEFIILLRFLNDPENRVLLIAVLRGIFFGISDKAIAEYKLSGGVFKIYAEVPESLSEDTKALFETAYGKLSMYHRWSRKYHPVTVFEKIAADIGLLPLTLAGNEAQTGCGYIIKILEMLRQNATEDCSGFNSLVDVLDAIFDADLEEELDITGEEQDAVRIMNLHKAKGLEAPVVFLSHPCKRPNIPPDHHIKRTESKSEGYFVIKKQTGEFSSKIIGRPLNWDKYELEEKEYQDAEETRLLYVAATRAKNLLFISASEKFNSKNPWEPLLNYTDPENDTYEIPEVLPPQKVQRETLGLIEKHDLEDFKNEIDNFISEAAKPTYIELSVSDIISEEPLHTVKGGLGPEWGSAIHEIIESLVRDETSYGTYKTMILRQYGFTDPVYEKKAEELIVKFKESELYSRIQNAEMKLAEVPFSIKLDANDPICGLLNIKNSLPVILQGKIDLAVKENGGWSIIDYKTNYFEKEEDLNLLVNHYSKQIKLYCLIWERITNEKVTGGELYFTGAGSVIVNI